MNPIRERQVRRQQSVVLQAKAVEAARQLRTEQCPRRRDLLEAAAVRWSHEAVALRKMSQAQARAITTSVLCGAGSAILLVPPALAPWADVSPVMWVGGLLGPAAIAAAFWQIKAAVEAHDERRAEELDPTARLGAAQVRMAEAEQRDRYADVQVRPARGEVIEGEVVR